MYTRAVEENRQHLIHFSVSCQKYLKGIFAIVCSISGEGSIQQMKGIFEERSSIIHPEACPGALTQDSGKDKRNYCLFFFTFPLFLPGKEIAPFSFMAKNEKVGKLRAIKRGNRSYAERADRRRKKGFLSSFTSVRISPFPLTSLLPTLRTAAKKKNPPSPPPLGSEIHQ